MDYPRIYNAAADLVDRNVTLGRGTKTAFLDPGETLTYGELSARTNRMANLVSTYGIPRESRIALLMLDTIDFPVVFWGAIKAGVVPVCLNTLLTAEQYAYILGDSRAKALFVSAPLLPVVQPILGQLPFLKHVFVSGGEPPSFALPLRGELGFQQAETQLADTCSDETAFWLYSSGSTGMPKGVRHVHSSLMETARLTGQDCLGIREDDVIYSAAKLFFAYGLGNSMTFPMSVGATAVLLPERPTPEAVFRTLKQYRATMFFGAPTLYAASFFLAMNKAKFESLPADLRSIVDKNSGQAFARLAGKMWDDAGVAVMEMVKKRGNTITVLEESEKKRWMDACKPVTEAWIKQVKEKGLDGAKMIDAARALVAKYDKA